MGKKKIILPSACLEKGGFGLSHYSRVQSLFEYQTTRFVVNSLRQRGVKVPSIIVNDFSSDEMIEFLDFMDNIKALSSIGINDSSVIYYAFKNNITIFINDDTTLRICSTLGISFITELINEEEITSEQAIDIQDKKISIKHEMIQSEVSMILDKSFSLKNIRL